MLMKKIVSLFNFAICLGLMLISCNKSEFSNVIVSNTPNNIVYNIKHYIDSVKNIDSSTNSHLINNILWGSSISRNINDKKQFVFIPINIIGDDSTTNGLLAILDHTNNNIQECYFVQVANSNKSYNGNGAKLNPQQISYSVNAIENHLSPKQSSFSGSIGFYTVFNKMMFNIGYLDGKKNYLQTLQDKNGAQAGIERQSNSFARQVDACYDHYLVTYYTDGSSTMTYLYTYCDNCQQTAIINQTGTRIYQSNCTSGGSSASANNGGSGPSTVVTNNDDKYPVKKVRNPDGTFTMTFTATNLSFSNAYFTVNVDSNYNYISATVYAAGVLSYIMAPSQNSQAYTTNNFPNNLNPLSPGYLGLPIQITFFIQGTLVLPSNYSWSVQPSVCIYLNSSGMGPYATTHWGFRLFGGYQY